MNRAQELPFLVGLVATNDGTGWLLGTALLQLRVSATLAMSPVFHALPQARLVRIPLLLLLAACISASLGVSALPAMEWGEILVAAMYEVALGATLGLGVLIAFAAFAVAGQILDAQLGFGLAQIVDPVTMRPVPVLTSAFNDLAALVFFALNGHHALLRGISYSLERFPLGSPWSTAQALGPLLKQAAGLFGLGFALVAPVVFCILLIEFALGVVSRNLPQMNMFVMGIPIKIIVGLAALSFWLGGAEAAMMRIYASIVLTWTQIFEDASPGMAGVR